MKKKNQNKISLYKQIFILLLFLMIIYETNNSKTKLKLKSKEKLMSRSQNKIKLRNKQKHRSQSKSKSKEEIQLSLDDLQQLTDSERLKIDQFKKRYTKDGRSCASAFAFNGQVYKDCTDGVSPDNKNTGDEWCYVDANAGGSPNWGYCKPILDYDSVRRKTQQQYIKMTVEARKVDHLVAEQIMPTSKLNQMVQQVKQKQLLVDFKINLINNQIIKVNDNYNTLLKLKDQYEELEAEISTLKQELEALQAKKDAEAGKDPNNCDGMLGYENEGPGDGVIGMYYDNEDFIGQPAVERVENQVDFMWDNEEPAPGINQDNFSIKFQTWLRVPVNGKYNFYTESDDGNQLLLNGKPIIKHFWGETGKEGGNWLDSHIGNLRKNMKPGVEEFNSEAGTITAQSFPVNLEGGNKYKLEFQMYHSVHNEEQDTGQSFGKLYWENELMEKQIIGQDFLYTQNKIPPVKIYNYDPKLVRISEIRENDDAFLNNDIYKLQDIPFQYQGAAGLKLIRDWPSDEFKFSVNGAIILYAVVSSTENPLPDDFKFTTDILSIMKINPKQKPENNRIKALSSECYFIYKKTFQQGDHEIKLLAKKEGRNNMLFFYTPDPGAGSQLSCGGEEVLISKPDFTDFSKCSESSRFNKNGWGCAQGFSGKLEDNESAAWATEQQGVGSYIQLELKNPYQISKVQIKDRNNAIERNKQMEIKFDGGETRQIQLKNLDSVQTFKIEPAVISKTIRFTIKQVYSMGNNGGSFNVMGTPCVDPKKLEKAEVEGVSTTQDEEPKELTANCEDTLLSGKFTSLGLKPSLELLITCEDSCYDKDGNIFGDGEYSEDSVICKSAFHAGAISDKGGQFKVTIEAGLFEYSASYKSGVQSKSKQGNSLLSMLFQKHSETTDILDQVKEGMKIDIYDTSLKNWLPGVIQSVERKSQQYAQLLVLKENLPDDTKETLLWPNPDKLDYCGHKVINRVCDKESQAPDTKDNFSLKIAFGLSSAPQDYIQDKGEKFSEQNGYHYGWTLDASKNVRVREEGEGIENQLILFAPDKKSNYCLDPNPKISCEENDWKIQVKKGTYEVKLVMGDKKYQSQYDISVNGVRFISGKILKKDQFFSESKKIKVSGTKPFLQISTKCQAESCSYSWSRISAITIEKVKEEEKEQKEEETRSLGCGEAFEGGKCSIEGQDNENCIYSKYDTASQNCHGLNQLIPVDINYFCKDQIGKFKCIKKKFNDQSECEKKCPGKCKQAQCITRQK